MCVFFPGVTEYPLGFVFLGWLSMGIPSWNHHHFGGQCFCTKLQNQGYLQFDDVSAPTIRVFFWSYKSYTLLTNMSNLKMDGWKMIVSFWGSFLANDMLASGSVIACTFHRNKSMFKQPTVAFFWHSHWKCGRLPFLFILLRSWPYVTTGSVAMTLAGVERCTRKNNYTISSYKKIGTTQKLHGSNVGKFLFKVRLGYFYFFFNSWKFNRHYDSSTGAGRSFDS